jgi:tetratricopeptide (TPR) repeat protein
MLDLAEVDARMSTSPSDEARARCVDCAARAKRQGLAVEQARAALTYGRELLSGRVDGLMVSLLEDALAVVPPEERSLRAQLLARLAAAMTPPRTDPALEAAKRHAHAALAIAREGNDVPTLLHTLFWCSHALIYIVPLRERVDLLGELASLAREHGADLILANLAVHTVSLLESGRPIAARRDAEAYYRLMETLPLPGLKWKATALRATLAGIAGQLDEARSYTEELRRVARSSPQAAGAWAFFELALCVCTRDDKRLREIEAEVVEFLSSRHILRPWLACVYALLGKREEAFAHFQPPESLSRGPTSLLAQAQAAVFLESAELAEQYYEPLLRAEPFARFFWGGAVFPLGPVSRILGELALLRGDHERAREHFDTAIAECREMEAVPFLALAEEARSRVAGRTTMPSATTAPSAAQSATQSATRRAEKTGTITGLALAREGDVWVVSASHAAPFRVKHAKGMEYLDHLLRSPGREVYVLVLAGAAEGPEDAGAILDPQARQAYKERVEDLEDQLDEAERRGDSARASRAREELEAVAEQLASAVGLGGRDRKAASNVERARVNVQRRLKDAIRRIAEHDAVLGRYLDATVRTGTYCVYRPV